jgi:hypothetical protein
MIEDYGFGRITINGKTYHSDVLLFPERVDDQWWRQESHRLRLEDLRSVMEAHPDALVVGTGYFGRMRLDPVVEDRLKQEGIHLIACETKKACAEFNRLRATQNVVAALHLTC